MNCCNDFGQCQQGHGCPVRATRHYTCAELGVCNYPGPDCQCDATLDAADQSTTPFEAIAYYAAATLASVASVVVVCGLAGYLLY